MHFGTALLVAAILSAPWQALWTAGLLLGLSGLGGMIYVVIVLRRACRQTSYQPILEDWPWHTVLPLVSYTALVVTAMMLLGHPAPALFVIAAGTLLLLFISIHNAWDQDGTPPLAQIAQALSEATAQEHILIQVQPKAFNLFQDREVRNHIVLAVLALEHGHLQLIEMTPAGFQTSTGMAITRKLVRILAAALPTLPIDLACLHTHPSWFTFLPT